MKILVAHDFLTSQYRYEKEFIFFERILEKFPVSVTNASDEGFNFSIDIFNKLINKDKQEMPFQYFSEGEVNVKAMEYIEETVCDYDFFIFFELSETSKKIFDKLKCKYIDLWVSPIRFHKDVMLNIGSNDKKILKSLKKYEFPDFKVYKRALKLKSYIENFSDSIVDIEKKSALIVGQLKYDKSVMKEGFFLSLLDYKEHVFKLSDDFRKLYFLKHPMMENSDFLEIYENFSALPNIEYIEGVNAYHLLASQNLEKVVGISSSLLTEAKYFGKEVQFLYRPVIDDNYVLVYKSFYKSKFWESVLGLAVENKFEYLVHDNYLRYNAEKFYAYKDFLNDNFEPRMHHLLIYFYNDIMSIPKGKNVFMYGFGSIGKLIYPLIRDNIKGVLDKSINDDYVEFDGASLKVVKVEELKEDDWVIISAIKYNEVIRKEVEKYTKNIVEINL